MAKYKFEWWGNIENPASFKSKAEEIKTSEHYHVGERIAVLYYLTETELLSIALEMYFDENNKQQKTYLHGCMFNHEMQCFGEDVETTFEQDIDYTFENAKEKMLEFAKMICKKYSKR